MRQLQTLAAGLAGLLLTGCGSPVPGDMFLTLSVSTRDVAVETRINGGVEEFVSGGPGLVSSAPVNRRVREGENMIEFALTPARGETGAPIDPSLIASLEILLKGEVVDTLTPGARGVFLRELTAGETARLAAGEALVLTERFTLAREELEAMKAASR